MKYSDINIHLPSENLSPSLMLEQELSLHGSKLLNNLYCSLDAAGSNLQCANIMIFNQDISINDVKDIKDIEKQLKQSIYLSLLASPRRINTIDQLEELKYAGISAIKFHSYQQFINSEKFDAFLQLSKWAEYLSLPILGGCILWFSKNV